MRRGAKVPLAHSNRSRSKAITQTRKLLNELHGGLLEIGLDLLHLAYVETSDPLSADLRDQAEMCRQAAQKLVDALEILPRLGRRLKARTDPANIIHDESLAMRNQF